MNHFSIRRDGKSIQLTAEEMLEAYQRVREDLIEQDLLLRFSDSDVLDNLSEVLFLSNSERGILEDILLVPGSAFLHGVSDSVAHMQDFETYEDAYADMLYETLMDDLRAYFNAYRN